MIKKTGDKKVSTWDHYKGGVTCDIYLRGTRFVATLLEEEFEAPDISMLKAKLEDKAEHWMAMEWFALIEVEVTAPGHSYRDDPEGESIEFKRKRFYVSRSPGGRMFECAWDVEEHHRKAKMQVYGGGGYHRGERERDLLKLAGLPLRAPLPLERETRFLMDYSEELWLAFDNIVKGIHALRRKIAELVTTKKGIAQLLSGGSGTLLLNAAPKKGK